MASNDRETSDSEESEDDEEEESEEEKGSYHLKKRQLFLKELQEYCSDDEEEGGVNQVAMETFNGQVDLYAGLHQSFATSASKIAELREQYGQWKRGRWSRQETVTLKRNVRAYMKAEHITDVNTLIYSTNKSIDFYRNIACDINRPLFIIYRKVIKLFNDNNYVREWTKEMNKELLRLHGIHGNKWAVIGRSMGIRGQTVCDHYKALLRRRKQKGTWSRKEEAKLYKVMKEYCGNKPEECLLPQTATWNVIAERMGSRTGLQCRYKWVNMLAWKVKYGGKEKKWTVADDKKLIETLCHDKDLNDEEDVDWEKLAESWPSARSKYYLREKWQALKRTVPNYHMLLFQDCVSHLWTKRCQSK